MTKNTDIYVLKVEDIQRVANDEVNRDLSKDEILEIEDEIAKNIDWYEAIRMAINNKSIF